MNRFALVVLLVPSICSAEVKFGTLPASSKVQSAVDASKAGCKVRTYIPGQPLAPQEFGSGVNTANGVLTCHHVIEIAIAQGKTIEVECDGEKATAVVTFQDAQNDVAMLRPKWVQDHLKVQIEQGKPSIGDSVRTLCMVRDGTLGSETAKITGSTFDGKILIDLATISGMSGGGVVNSDGRLIGIISGNRAVVPFNGLIIPIRQMPGRGQ